MHQLEYVEGIGDYTHPVDQKQNKHSGADHILSGAQVSLRSSQPVHKLLRVYEPGVSIIRSKLLKNTEC